MTDEILHSVEFVTRDEGQIYAITARTQIPVPDSGEVVTFGWYEDEESGNRVEIVDFERTGVEYNRTERYEVLDIETHYHHAKTESNYENTLAANEIQITTKVIVEEYEQ